VHMAGFIIAYVFIYSCSVFLNSVCVSMRLLASTLYTAGVNDVWVRSFDERTIERWKPNYSRPIIERLSWINLLKISFYTVSSTKIFPG
jgi:hypothetical protein